jgi:hypothetical protein
VADQDAYGGGFEGNGGGEAGGASIDKLSQAFDQFQQSALSKFEALEQHLRPEEEEPDTFAELRFGVDDVERLSPDGERQAIRQLVREAALERVAGMESAREDDRRELEATALEAKYTDLQDPAQQDHYISLAVERANAFGRPELAREPAFLEQTYLAAKAQTQGADEIPAGSEPQVQLERSGAASGGGGQEPDAEDAMVRAHGRGRHHVVRSGGR